MLKKGIILLCSALLLLASCVSTRYVGKSYPATAHVDVFFSRADVPRNFEVMGYMDAIPDGTFASVEKTQKTLEAAAKAKGADAIVLEGMQTDPRLTTIDQIKVDENGGATRVVTSSEAKSIWASFSKVVLIKYQ